MLKPIKLTQKPLILPILSFALCSFLLASCSSSNNNESPTKPETDGLVAETLFNIQVVNAADEPVDSTLTIVAGTDANDVIPQAQESQSTLASRGGRATYSPNSLNNDEETVFVTAAAANHLSNTVPVTIIKGKTLNQRIVINKIPTAGEVSPTGIGATVVEGVNNADAPTVVIAKTNRETPEAEGRTIVAIPQAASATDSQGNTLSSTLSVVVAQFDPDERAALRSFPGGFFATVENPSEIDTPSTDGTDGEIRSTGELVFKSVGFTAIEVKDDQGRIAKNFDPSTPITITTKIAGGSKHPTATPERDIRAGDIIPIWSYESSTGKWRYEKEGTVTLDENGDNVVKYTVTHLSWYNLDYYGSTCTAVLNINGADGQPLSEQLTGEVYSYNNGWTHPIEYHGDGIINLRKAPADIEVNFDLYTANGLQVTTSPSGPFNLCSGITTIDATPVGTQVFADTTVNVSTFCSNDTSALPEPVDAALVEILNLPNWDLLASERAIGGSSNFNFRPGEYIFRVWNPLAEGYVQKTVQVTETQTNVIDLSIPQTCVVTTGGATDGT